ncbi:putative mannosyltransferase [Gregarina niphandrodes]|uniref:GPI mannosyltransferase I n=1 Tax=Gregarina niphandrodes TaxID=110365 RepID=A0A023BCG7_GRENI|nr:putative mannosyltransferase [Gregarina niphandrodes]EZG83075.1 putative mannosyltransferase [Gregarina niphandrodes]|eukprot:XP_011128956.1 putative mannosyltransferase [Gregarina niphandrodes]
MCLLEPGVWHGGLWKSNESDWSLQFTDIDYAVFVGGQEASLRPHYGLPNGNLPAFDSFLTTPNPYGRVTYRYTPLMALLTYPNWLFGDSAGKYVFCILNFVTFHYIKRILRLFHVAPVPERILMALVTLNPVIIQVAARGNSDAIMTSLVAATIYYYLRKRYLLAACLHGLSIHMKMYPILFTVPLVIGMNSWTDPRQVISHVVGHSSKKANGLELATLESDRTATGWFALYEASQNRRLTLRTRLTYAFILATRIAFWPLWIGLEWAKRLTTDQWLFGFLSVAVGFGLTAIVYFRYGWVALYEGFLYHFVRHDHRHNMAVVSTWATLITPRRYYGFKLPTLLGALPMKILLTIGNKLLVILSGLVLVHISVPLALFVQVLLFVAFNGVVTVQYFVWYMSLLPLAIATAPKWRSTYQGKTTNWRECLRLLKPLLTVWLPLWLTAILSWVLFSDWFEHRARGDAGVATAVGLVTSNKESLMLSKYGLNALAELLTPPKIKYRENALEAFYIDDGGVISALNSLASKLKTPQHDEQAEAIAKILKAIFEAAEEYESLNVQGALAKTPVAKVLSSLAAVGIQVEGVLTPLIYSVDKAANYDLISGAEAEPIAEGIASSLKEAEGISAETKGTAVLALCGIGNRNPGVVPKLAQAGVPSIAADYLESCNFKDKAEQGKAETCLRFLGQANNDYLKANETIEEKCRLCHKLAPAIDCNNKKISNLACKATSALFTDEEFFDALNTVGSPDADMPSRLQAYAVLGALAADTSYAQKIVDAGGIPSLLAALENSAANLASGENREQELSGVNSVLTLLTRIAQSGQDQVMLDNGLLDTLDNTLAQLDLSLDGPVAARLAGVLAAVCTNETVAQEAESRGLLSKILNLIQENCMNEDFQYGALEFIDQISTYASLVPSLINSSAFEILLTASQYHLDADRYQSACLRALVNLSTSVADVSYAAQDGGFDALAKSLAAAAGDVSLARLALDVLWNVSASANAESAMANENLIAAICLAIYVLNDPGITQLGKEILETVCTSDILVAIAGNGALANWRADPLEALKQVASCSVLCSIPGVGTPEAMDASVNATLGVSADMLSAEEETVFESAALRTALPLGDKAGAALFLAGLKVSGSVFSFAPPSLVDSRIGELSSNLADSGLARIILAEPTKESVLIEGLSGLAAVTQAGKVNDPAAVTAVVQACLRCHSTFEEFRHVSLATQEALGGVLKGPGAQQALELDAPVAIVNFTKRSKFQANSLLQGLVNIRYQIVNAEGALPIFKREGTLPVVLAAVRAHGANAKVREEAGRVIPLLMDMAEAEAAGARIVQELQTAHGKGEAGEGDMVNTLVEARGLCMSRDVARVVGRLGGAELLSTIANNRENHSEAKRDQITSEAMGVVGALASTIAPKLRQQDFFKTSAWLLQEESKVPTVEGIESSAFAARQLFGEDKDADAAYMYSTVTTCCQALNEHGDSAGVVDQCGRLLKSIAQDPRTRHLATSEEMKQALVDAAQRLPTERDRRALLALLAGGLAAGNADLSSLVLQHIDLALLSGLLDNPTEGPLALQVLEGLGHAGGELRDNWDQQTEDSTLVTTVQQVIELIGSAEDDPDTIAGAIAGFNALTRAGKDTATSKLAMSPVLSALVSKYEGSHAGFREAVNNLYSNLPPVGTEMQGYIRAAIDAYNGSDMTGMNRNLMLIVAALRAPIQDPEVNMAEMPELLQCLTAMGAGPGADKNAAGMGVKIMSQLAQKYEDNPFGYVTLMENNCHQVLLSVDNKSSTLSSRGPSVKAASEAMTYMALNPDWRETFLEAHLATPIELSILEDFDREPDVKGSVVKLLDAILGGPPSPFVDALFENAEWKEKVTQMIVSEAQQGKGDMAKLFRLLEGVARSGVPTGLGDALMTAVDALINQLNDSDNVDSETGASVMNFADAINDIENALGREKGYALLEALSRKLAGMDDKGDIVKGRYFVKIKELIASDGPEAITMKLLDTLGDCLDAAQGNIQSILSPLEEGLHGDPETVALTHSVIETQQVHERIMQTNNEETPPIFNETESLNQYLRVLNDQLDDPVFKTKFVDMDALHQKLAQIDQNATKDAETEHLLDTIQQKLAEIVNEDGDVISIDFRNGNVIKNLEVKHLEGAPPPEELTVRKVYGYLKKRLVDEQEISPFKDQDPILMQWFEFVWGRLNEYSADERLTKEMFRGDECKWGCLCWELWLENDYDLCDSVLEWNVHDTICVTNLIAAQQTGAYKDVEICTPASSALSAIALKTTPGGRTVADLEGIAETLQYNIRVCLDDEVVYNRQDHMIPRLKAVERVAVDRRVFPDPGIQEVMLECWDRYDEGTYGNPLLRQLYRAMRRALHPNHVDLIKKQDVCRRLVDELKKNKDPTVLIDGFFLLGILAGFPACRDLIGKANGVEESLIVLRDHLSDAPNVGVVTNVLSALGNIVLDHRGNDDAFVRLDGLKTVVWVLNNRSQNYPEMNAAAALVANSSYRRDDIKALYGSSRVGGPAALTSAIVSYDGNDSEHAYRALTALFKAIANLALYTPNIDPIVDNGLAEAYYAILTQAEVIPDRVISASLLTLANITQEYVPRISAKFQPILAPLIVAGRSESRQDATLIALILDSIASLCRLEENAAAITESDGAGYVLSALTDWGSYSPEVLKSGVQALGQISKTTENIEAILSYDGLTLVTTILNGEYFPAESEENAENAVPDVLKQEIAALCFRCLRKLMAGYQWPETFGAYCQAGGISTWVWWLEQLCQGSDPSSAIITEALAVGAGLVKILSTPEADHSSQVYTLLHGQPLEEAGGGSGYGPTDRQEDPTFVDQMGLDVYTLGSAMHRTSVLMEVEASRQNARAFTPALYLLCMFVSYVPYVPGALESLLEGDQQYVMEAVDHNMSLTIESVGEQTDEAWELIAQLVMNGAYTWGSPAFDEQLRQSYKSVQKMMDKQPKHIRKGVERFFGVWKSLGPDTAQPYVQLHPDADRLTSWHREAYPNGVQDLAYKDELRKGGICEIVDEATKEKVGVFWRANQTLRHLQWRKQSEAGVSSGAAEEPAAATGKIRKRDKLKGLLTRMASMGQADTEAPVKAANIDLGTLEFTSQLPAGRVRFSKGAETSAFKAYGVGGVSGVSPDKCISILGPPTAENPAGEELSMVFGSKKERDYILLMFTEWRHALANQ